MIGYLEGKITWKSRDKIIINVGGTGYLVYISDITDLPEQEQSVSLFIYTYVRDDTLDLYGFSSMKERELFALLLSVSRVGPRAGMNILSTLTYEEFVRAILQEEIVTLKQVTGIGPKTAKRLILELQEKIKELGQEYQTTTADRDSQKDLFEALNSLGYSQREIETAVSELDFPANMSLEDKIKQTLSYLGKENY